MCGHNARISMRAKFTNLRSAAAVRPPWRGLRALAPDSPASERAYQCGPDLRSPRTSSLCREGAGFRTAMHRRHGHMHTYVPALADTPRIFRCLLCAPHFRFMLPAEGFAMRVVTPRGCEWAWVVAVGWAWERAGARRKGRWRAAVACPNSSKAGRRSGTSASRLRHNGGRKRDGDVRRVGAQRRGWWKEVRSADIV
ncbi:hypothetical protein C8J57DRAFT_1341333 [Mycena rebaudengoi]|nr:hypothetical protein C8J57DRAFT_1341333 [Mycena rebaudengoi]